MWVLKAFSDHFCFRRYWVSQGLISCGDREIKNQTVHSANPSTSCCELSIQMMGKVLTQRAWWVITDVQQVLKKKNFHKKGTFTVIYFTSIKYFLVRLCKWREVPLMLRSPYMFDINLLGPNFIWPSLLLSLNVFLFLIKSL